MILSDLLATYRPESHGGTRGETWAEHAEYLWAEDADYMCGILAHLIVVGGWFGGPVVVDGRVVQDAHHRLIAAMLLRWFSVDVPVVPA